MCEHQQAQGIECEVCGKKLAVAAPIAVAVSTLPELEGTQLAGGRAPVAVAAIQDLELTRQAPVQAGAIQPVAELDTGRAVAAGNVVVAPIQDMDTGRAVSDGLRFSSATIHDWAGSTAAVAWNSRVLPVHLAPLMIVYSV